MSEFLEIVAVGFSVALILSLILGFITFMRYLRYKERKVLAENGLSDEKVSFNE